jgi:prepilin signal peptidase PulO-like enzyme (type II secretory pathway)
MILEPLNFFVVFVLGLLVGSFMNVVILRFGTGLSIAKGRSKCFACGKGLSWYELVPLLSFLFQMGKCRGCFSKISWQYPLVELSTALAFVLIYSRTINVATAYESLIAFVLLCVFFCLYIAIFVYDFRHKIIPDAFSYTAALVALALIALEWRMTGTIDLYKVIAGPSLFLFFYFFWFVSRGTWMGFGDAKLALSVGWFLGLWKGIAAILLSFWIGAVVSLLIILVQRFRTKRRRLGMKSEIPFAPFILIGFAIAFIWGLDIQRILSALAL